MLLKKAIIGISIFNDFTNLANQPPTIKNFKYLEFKFNY